MSSSVGYPNCTFSNRQTIECSYDGIFVFPKQTTPLLFLPLAHTLSNGPGFLFVIENDSDEVW